MTTTPTYTPPPAPRNRPTLAQDHARTAVAARHGRIIGAAGNKVPVLRASAVRDGPVPIERPRAGPLPDRGRCPLIRNPPDQAPVVESAARDPASGIAYTLASTRPRGPRCRRSAGCGRARQRAIGPSRSERRRSAPRSPGTTPARHGCSARDSRPGERGSRARLAARIRAAARMRCRVAGPRSGPGQATGDSRAPGRGVDPES